jgi:hypothetical protein
MLKRVKIQGYKSLVDVEVKLQPLSVLFLNPFKHPPILAIPQHKYYNVHQCTLG